MTTTKDLREWQPTGQGPFPFFLNHPDLGYVEAQALEVGDNPDEQVAATIALMQRYAVEDSQSECVQRAVALACRLYGCGNVIDAIHRWVRSSCRFVHDEDSSSALQRFDPRPIVEVLLRPVEMLHFRRGDCDDFSMLSASMLLAAGVACNFVTIAAEPSIPNDFSHVYVAAYPAAGGRVAVDASHGPRIGWEARAYRKAEWPVRGKVQ